MCMRDQKLSYNRVVGSAHASCNITIRKIVLNCEILLIDESFSILNFLNQACEFLDLSLWLMLHVPVFVFGEG